MPRVTYVLKHPGPLIYVPTELQYVTRKTQTRPQHIVSQHMTKLQAGVW